MADTTTPKRGSIPLRRAISGGMNSRDTFGSMMGFMGLPWITRGSDRLGGYAGPPHQAWATDFYGSGFRGHHGGGNGGGNEPTTGGEDPGVLDDGTGGGGDTASQYWKFPQYSQTWAFTPPEPTPYQYPQPFDPAKYGNPFAKSKK